MKTPIHRVILFSAVAALGGQALAQVPTPPPPPPAAPALHGLFRRPNPTAPAVPITGGIIGNKKSHVYHMAGDKSALPAEKNRVYFRSEAEAEAAGYHRAGQGRPMHTGHPRPMSGRRPHPMGRRPAPPATPEAPPTTPASR